MNQGGLVKRGGRRTAVAVLSDGSPSHAYGVATVRGIARRILRPRRTARFGRASRRPAVGGGNLRRAELSSRWGPLPPIFRVTAVR